ncbi:hypothetical protein FCM35_KLT06702 [Carex littledalei]|uniref:Uncharacterized protein n=1 Tax=Carex littledalei TaxID=544730 RepID=A0A833QUD2_9POAL|nr:hypothetical protein FCM35_KLT06702 [Carex littledalei]
MAPPINLPFSYLRLQPLPLPHCRLRLRPILAASSFASHNGAPRIRTSKPPRDIKIKIGRYKGRMLGTLPPSYLKWLSNPDVSDPDIYLSLATWSDLAKQVLQDPVYQDRIEWEPAWKIFTGEGRGNFYESESFDWKKAYNDIGEKYGWDMDDKEGWSKVKRELIGTSFSARIPRKKDRRSKLRASESVKSEVIEKKKRPVLVGGKKGERIERMRMKREKLPGRIEVKEAVNKSEDSGYLDDQNEVKNDENCGLLVGKNREERIERMRLRREEKAQMVRSNEVVEEEILEEKEVELPRIRIKKEGVKRVKRNLGKRRRQLGTGLGRNDEIISFAEIKENSGNVEVFNPFPGRDALLEKIKSGQD